MSFSPDELLRYSRHTLLPEFGEQGQARLKAGKALVIGAGGLGSPAALYLAAAGVGTLGLVDFDVVDVTNLQRQVLYGTSDVGRPKLEVAASRLSDINPLITLNITLRHSTLEMRASSSGSTTWCSMAPTTSRRAIS